MLDALIYSLIYIVGEFLPFDGEAHLKLFSYYSKKPFADVFLHDLFYFSIIFAAILFFFKDILYILKDSLKSINNLRTGRSSLKTVTSEYKFFNSFIFIVFLSCVNFLIINYFPGVFYLHVDYFWISIFLILSGLILLTARFFSVIKVFPFIFSIRELLVFAFISFVSIIPGLSRMALMLAASSMLGFDKKNAYKFSIYSLLSFLFFMLYKDTYFSLDFFSSIFNSDYIYVFVFNVLFVLFILKVFYNYIASIRVTRFYLYLFLVGIWTILDLIFSKRGL